MNFNAFFKQRVLPANYFLIMALFLVLLPHFAHLPLWLSLVCASFLVWKLLIDFGWLKQPHKYLVLFLLLLLVLGVVTSYRTVLGREAGSALLLALICLKLFELKTMRDISVLVQLAFFAIIVTFLFEQTIFVAFNMLLAVILFITALIGFSRSATYRHYSIQQEKQHLLFSLKIVAYALPLAVVIFIVFPRINAPLWGLPADAFYGKTGLADEMSPGRISQLVESPEVAFRVEFKTKIPDNNQMYWRGPVLSYFDGYTWRAEKYSPQIPHQTKFIDHRELLSYSITLEPHNKKWLFGLDIPIEIPATTKLSHDAQLLATEPVRQLFRYELTSNPNYKLDFINPSPANMGYYLNVPDNIAPRARQLIEQLKRQHHSNTALIDAVLDYFINQPFYYSRTPPLLFDDPIDEFLFDTRRGYCEHYASTFTILMRLAGIPARVVTGYQGGELNPLDNYLIVRQSNAHAWSEVYFVERGWVRFDPTFVLPPNRIEASDDVLRLNPRLGDTQFNIDKPWAQRLFRQMRFALDMINNRWNQWVVGYNNKRQQALFKAFGIPDISWQGLTQILFTSLALFSLYITYHVFKSTNRKIDKASKIYTNFLRKLKRHGLVKADNEGAIDFAKRVVQRFPAQQEQINYITTNYYQLRYGKGSAEQLNIFRRAVVKLNLH